MRIHVDHDRVSAWREEFADVSRAVPGFLEPVTEAKCVHPDDQVERISKAAPRLREAYGQVRRQVFISGLNIGDPTTERLGRPGVGFPLCGADHLGRKISAVSRL